MSPCESLTRPSTRRFSSAMVDSPNSWVVYEPGELRVSPHPAAKNVSPTSANVRPRQCWAVPLGRRPDPRTAEFRIGTLVERTTRFTMLLHLPRMPGHGQQQRVHNGPPLAGHGAQAVRDAIAESITTLPQQLRRSLAWDHGTEMEHAPPNRHNRYLLLPPKVPGSVAPTVVSSRVSPKCPISADTPRPKDASRGIDSTVDPENGSIGRLPPKPNDVLHSLEQDTVATTP